MTCLSIYFLFLTVKKLSFNHHNPAHSEFAEHYGIEFITVTVINICKDIYFGICMQYNFIKCFKMTYANIKAFIII